MPRIPYVRQQDRINFVSSVVRKKVFATGLAKTAACKVLAPGLDLSYATLLHALNGKFTRRTVARMIDASWFTNGEYRTAQQSYYPGGPSTQRTNQTRQSNDQAQQKERERAAFKRGYSKGKTDGFTAGVRQAQRNSSGDYTRGYNDGLRDSRNVRSNRNNSPAPSSLPMTKLSNLFKLNASQGCTIGEVTAARKAAGVTLAKWIKAQFGEDVTINMS